MRLLHTMLRVGDLQRSIDFYTRILGMKVLRQSENTEYKYTLAFVGYGDESETSVLELTYNWGIDKYDLGTAYGHIALEVDDAAGACDRIREAGGKVTREAGSGERRHDGDRVRRRSGRLQGRTDRKAFVNCSAATIARRASTAAPHLHAAPPRPFARAGSIGGKIDAPKQCMRASRRAHAYRDQPMSTPALSLRRAPDATAVIVMIALVRRVGLPAGRDQGSERVVSADAAGRRALGDRDGARLGLDALARHAALPARRHARRRPARGRAVRRRVRLHLLRPDAHDSASRMAVFLYTAPCFTALGLHWFVAGERMRRMQWLGIVVAFCGIALAFADGFLHGNPNAQRRRSRASRAMRSACSAGMLWAATTVVVRATSLAHASASKTLFYQLAVSAVLLLALAFGLGQTHVGRRHAARAREPRVSGDRRRVHQLSDVVLAADALYGVAALGVLVSHADLRRDLRRAAARRAVHAAFHDRRGDGADRHRAGQHARATQPRRVQAQRLARHDLRELTYSATGTSSARRARSKPSASKSTVSRYAASVLRIILRRCENAACHDFAEHALIDGAAVRAAQTESSARSRNSPSAAAGTTRAARRSACRSRSGIAASPTAARSPCVPGSAIIRSTTSSCSMKC